MATQNRTAEKRANNTREASARAPMRGWRPPSKLDAPPPQEGMVQRWVATSILGKDDPSNYAKRMREGWTPRDPSTLPEDFPVPTIEDGKYKGFIGIEGMVLCEMPEEYAQERKEYYNGKTQEQNAAVRNAVRKLSAQTGEELSMTDQTRVERGSRPGKVMDD